MGIQGESDICVEGGEGDHERSRRAGGSDILLRGGRRSRFGGERERGVEGVVVV